MNFRLFGKRSITHPEPKKTASLMHRFVISTVFISIICSSLLSVLIVMIELDDLISERDTIAKEKLESVSASAAFAAYNLDIRVTKSILQGFKNDNIFNRIVIKDNFEDVLYVIDNSLNKHSHPPWLVEIVKGENASYIEIPLLMESHIGNSLKLINVGSIQAQLNESDALDSSFRLLLNIISYSIIITGFIIIIICFLFRQLIDLPMASIIKSINEIELYESDKSKRIALTDIHQSNEFLKLVDAYNKSADRTCGYMEELHLVTDELRCLSRIDPLTNACNRRALIDKLTKICALEPATKWAIVATDLDSFSEINDTYGHEIGDFVLKNFYQQIKLSVPNEAFISRTGGDEFIILIPIADMKNIDNIPFMLANLIKISPAHPNIIHHQYIEASFGVSLFPTDGVHPRELLNCADLALYHAKNKGKRRIELFCSSMFIASEKRIKLHRQIDELIENKQFLLFYQPKVQLSDGKIIGCEALLRLTHQADEAPFELIDSAEKSGLIVPLGAAILERAFTEFVSYLTVFPDDFRLSVNVSTRQFEANDFIPILVAIASRTRFPLTKLDIEITESAQLEYSEELALKRQWLKKQGCTLTLDDFGTGFASLEYLIKFAFDQVKIDKAFVENLPSDKNSQTINSVVKFLSSKFNMTVVAEGIETKAQEKWLDELGIDCGQGYLYAQAEPMPRLIARLAENNSQPEPLLKK